MTRNTTRIKNNNNNNKNRNNVWVKNTACSMSTTQNNKGIINNDHAHVNRETHLIIITHTYYLETHWMHLNNEHGVTCTQHTHNEEYQYQWMVNEYWIRIMNNNE